MWIKTNAPFIKLCIKMVQTLNKQHTSYMQKFIVGSRNPGSETKTQKIREKKNEKKNTKIIKVTNFFGRKEKLQIPNQVQR